MEYGQGRDCHFVFGSPCHRLSTAQSVHRGGWDPLSLFGDADEGPLLYAHHFSPPEYYTAIESALQLVK